MWINVQEQYFVQHVSKEFWRINIRKAQLKFAMRVELRDAEVTSLSHQA